MRALVSRPLRSHRLLITAVVAVVLLGALVPGLVAAEERAGDTVVVAEDETIDEDLSVYGGQVVVRGTVNGDLEVFAGQVDVTGEVTGDVNVFGGNVRLAGPVGGDVDAFGGNVVVDRNARIDGSLDAAAGNVAVDGRVNGDARLGAGTVSLGPNAQVAGNLEYDGELNRDPGAQVAGTVSRNEEMEFGGGLPVSGDVSPVFDWLLSLYGLLVNLLLGVVLLAAFPAFSDRVAEQVTGEPVRSGGVGLLALVATPVVLVLLALTLVGLPLSLLGAFLFGVLAWVASVYGRVALGAWLLSLFDREGRYLALLAGLLVAFVVGLVPFVGDLFQFVLFVLGLGAVAVAVVREYRSRRGEPGATGATESDAATPADA